MEPKSASRHKDRQGGMEVEYVFGIALGLALWVGLEVRKALERREATELALAAFRADPDRGWPPITSTSRTYAKANNE